MRDTINSSALAHRRMPQRRMRTTSTAVLAALHNTVVSLMGQAGAQNLPDLQRTFGYHY